MRKILYFLIPILVILGALEYLLFYSINQFTVLIRKDERNDPKDLLFSSNEISFRTDDGVELYGWLIQGRAGYPVIIITHPYDSNRSMFLLKLEGLISNLNKSGYFVFLFDFRGHGKSESRSTLGYRESADLESALKTLLKYKQISHRVAVLGVGMGAIATSSAFQSVEEVKLIILDSVYENIPEIYSERIITEWPFLSPAKPLLVVGLDFNLRRMMQIPTTRLDLKSKMPMLYPKAVLFVEKKPLRPYVKELYDAAQEPKELLQLNETAVGELFGETREVYNRELEEKIRKYLPPTVDQRKLEIPQ